MTIDLATATGTRPRIAVVGVGGAGGNAIDTMVAAGLEGVGLVACNTDAQALAACRAGYHVRLGPTVTRGLGAGARPRSAGPRPRRAWARSSGTSPAATWCSSPPAWAAAPAPGRRP